MARTLSTLAGAAPASVRAHRAERLEERARPHRPDLGLDGLLRNRVRRGFLANRRTTVDGRARAGTLRIRRTRRDPHRARGARSARGRIRAPPARARRGAGLLGGQLPAATGLGCPRESPAAGARGNRGRADRAAGTAPVLRQSTRYLLPQPDGLHTAAAGTAGRRSNTRARNVAISQSYAAQNGAYQDGSAVASVPT